MEPQQEMEWNEAQKIPISVDLIVMTLLVYSKNVDEYGSACKLGRPNLT